jgi:hypothetical protein
MPLAALAGRFCEVWDGLGAGCLVRFTGSCRALWLRGIFWGMAFVCIATDQRPRVRLIGSDAIIHIGYDEFPYRDYSILMGLSPTGGGGLEYYFSIVEKYLVTDMEYVYWSGLGTRGFTTEADRRSILGAVLYGTEVMLNALQPPEFFCCTHDSDLPEKALRKHILLAQVFDSCGYEVEQQPFQLGKHSWWMERRK